MYLKTSCRPAPKQWIQACWIENYQLLAGPDLQRVLVPVQRVATDFSRPETAAARRTFVYVPDQNPSIGSPHRYWTPPHKNMISELKIRKSYI